MLSQKGQGSSEMENDRFMVTQILTKAMDVINFKCMLQDKPVTDPKEVADLVRLLRSPYPPLVARTTGPTYLFGLHRVSKNEHDEEPMLLLSQRRGSGLMDAMAKIIQGRLDKIVMSKG